MLKRVVRDYRSWQEQVPKPGRISINLSLKQLRQAEFLTRYRSVFDDAGVSPSNFELEITETTLMTEAGRMVRLLDELHAMGLHLSIDDFGTGYSSLSALQQFPVGTLKIDQSFVRHATVSKEDATLVRTIIEMGKNLDLKVVAEGIETQQQLDFLRSRDCHYGQGRLFGEPMTAEDFLQLLLAQSRGEAGYDAMFARPDRPFRLQPPLRPSAARIASAGSKTFSAISAAARANAASSAATTRRLAVLRRSSRSRGAVNAASTCRSELRPSVAASATCATGIAARRVIGLEAAHLDHQRMRRCGIARRRPARSAAARSPGSPRPAPTAACG